MNKLMMSQMRKILGEEAFNEMFTAQFDVGSGHEMLCSMIPASVHEKLHGPKKEDEMEEMIACSFCIYKLIQYITAQSKGKEFMFEIKGRWDRRKMEALR